MSKFAAAVYRDSQLKTTFPLRNAQEPQHLSKTYLQPANEWANVASTEWSCRRKNVQYMKLWF